MFQVVNDPTTLNVTTKTVNYAKGGAMRSFLNRVDGERLRSLSLNQFLRPKFESDSDIPANIDHAIVQTYDDFVQNKLPEAVTNPAARENFQDNLHSLVEKMKLDNFS